MNRLRLLLMLLGVCSAVFAQTGFNGPASEFVGDEPKSPSKPAPRTPDGHPDMNGYWKGTRQTKPGGNIAKDLPGFQLPFTPAGLAADEYNRTKTYDPEALCIIGGVPRHSASGLPFMIVQTPKAVVFLYFYSYYRIIPTDGRKHTEDPDPSFFGEEIGWWDGDTPVIDSIGFKDEKVWLDENAHPHSDKLHSVERWTRLDADRLYHEVLIDDPKFYTKPFKYTRTFVAGKEGQLLGEYSCSENNVDLTHLGFGPGPIRPDGTRGYVDPAPLPPLPAPVTKK